MAFVHVEIVFFFSLPFQLKVGFSLSDELVRKVNDITAAQEQGDGTVLISSEDGDRKLVFQRDLKVEFSNKTTQVMRDVIQNAFDYRPLVQCESM